MALLTLKDIGKIYVSEGNVAVGIRGVNLSFDRGEFVAVTGKSGSGKSTLLNVISGMDTYEEGELLIEGHVTSHYLQPDWEAYRERYISFIFQDYNIIESFTVLQNVELALMHIQDKRERKRRALELIGRVGLKDRVNQKGSKLSGGQKQRTVIARALAKDSPIILADEPTGNLDSKTSEEIIKLLKEVSKDKLLIVVTHNFEQVENCATRHIRIFDGAVESDQTIRPPEPVSERAEEVSAEDIPQRTEKSGRKKRAADLKNGATLGRVIFTAKPKLSVFMCFLLIVGIFAVFAITSFCGLAMQLFDKNYMFTHSEGRVVVTTREGAVSETEIGKLAEEYGAEEYLACDALLDLGGTYVYIPSADTYTYFEYGYREDYGNGILGRYPEREDEAFLYLPVSLRSCFGKTALKTARITVDSLDYRITGGQIFLR